MGMRMPPPNELSPDFSPLECLESEPPDIRKWYPNYKYESPSQDSSIPIFDLDSCGSQDFGKSRKRQVASHDAPSLDTIIAKEGKPIPTVKNMYSSGECDTSINRVVPSLRCELANHRCTLTRELLPDGKRVLPNKSSQLKEVDLLSRSSSKQAANPEAQFSTSIENESYDGWISTRNFKDQMNERPRKEVVFKIDGNIKSESIEKRNSPIDKTSIMVETQGDGGLMNQLTGKWCCPGKRKLNLAPLKQLRMERWVRRLV